LNLFLVTRNEAKQARARKDKAGARVTRLGEISQFGLLFKRQIYFVVGIFKEFRREFLNFQVKL
jgi:hypothetical protein